MATKALTKWENCFSDWAAVPAALTMKELCGLLRITKPTALKLLTGGQIPARKVGREWRIDKEAVRAYLTGTERREYA